MPCASIYPRENIGEQVWVKILMITLVSSPKTTHANFIKQGLFVRSRIWMTQHYHKIQTMFISVFFLFLLDQLLNWHSNFLTMAKVSDIYPYYESELK